MRLDVWPTQAQFRPNSPVGLVVRIGDGEPERRYPLAVRVSRLGDIVGAAEHSATTDAEGRARATLELSLAAIGEDHGCATGLAVEAAVEVSDAVRATTALDIAAHWSAAPRYGFFADFAPDEPAAESERRADAMLQLHLNVVQFYDWMASHHTFFASDEEFVDPLGRRLSHAVVRRKVALAHERGMAALAYGALYGAEPDFSDAHPDWLLYDGARQPLHLLDLFYLQDVGEGLAWRAWIIDQYEQAVDRLRFDGIHIDQYGFPKRALSRAGGGWREIDVAATFVSFVEEAASRVRARRRDGGSIFNCVNAWPLDALARASADAATYIEVWEPHTTYRDLYELVGRARALRPDKQVILAAYLRPFHPELARTPEALNAYRLATAAIHASGGFHLVAGEGGALLAEAYYPHYGRLSPDEFAVVRRYADFTVRCTQLLHGPRGSDIAWTHVGPTNDAIVLRHPDLATYGAGARPNTLWVI
ncbi:MAG: glycoside hydrolase family 66 protein, partial [Chloroflexota bacterium]